MGAAQPQGVGKPQAASQAMPLPGLDGPAQIVRDGVGVPHVYARSERDAYFLVGYLHAQDRLFQMDQSRRQASGTLAELLGPGALPIDAPLRTIGLRRAAARSLQVLSPQGVEGLEAYSSGVNAWLDSHRLASEYTALELTEVPPWTPLDSMAVAKLLAFGLSFGLEDIENTQRLIAYQTAGAAFGFDGQKLFSEDVMRSEPFAHAPSIMPGETSGAPADARPAAVVVLVPRPGCDPGGGWGADEREGGRDPHGAPRPGVERLGRLGR